MSEPLRLKTRDEWRTWLKLHHQELGEIWLVLRKKNKGGPDGIGYEDAVEDALAYGWIDSKMKSLGREEFVQRFSPRKKGSIWSLRNRKIVEKLIERDEMSDFGLEAVKEAKVSGSWDEAYSSKTAPPIPPDLLEALTIRDLDQAFERLSYSQKLMYIFWINKAKTTATRKRRID